MTSYSINSGKPTASINPSRTRTNQQAAAAFVIGSVDNKGEELSTNAFNQKAKEARNSGIIAMAVGVAMCILAAALLAGFGFPLIPVATIFAFGLAACVFGGVVTAIATDGLLDAVEESGATGISLENIPSPANAEANHLGIKSIEHQETHFYFLGDKLVGCHGKLDPDNKQKINERKTLLDKNEHYCLYAFDDKNTYEMNRIDTNNKLSYLENKKYIVPSAFIVSNKVMTKNIGGESAADCFDLAVNLETKCFEGLIKDFEACYEEGVLFTDIKPENIIMKNNQAYFTNTELLATTNPDSLYAPRFVTTPSYSAKSLTEQLDKVNQRTDPEVVIELVKKINSYAFLISLYKLTTTEDLYFRLNSPSVNKCDIQSGDIVKLSDWIDLHVKEEHRETVKLFIKDPAANNIPSLSSVLIF